MCRFLQTGQGHGSQGRRTRQGEKEKNRWNENAILMSEWSPGKQTIGSPNEKLSENRQIRPRLDRRDLDGATSAVVA